MNGKQAKEYQEFLFAKKKAAEEEILGIIGRFKNETGIDIDGLSIGFIDITNFSDTSPQRLTTCRIKLSFGCE